MRLLRGIVVLGLLVMMSLACTAKRAVEFETIEQGYSSRIGERTVVLITEPSEWEAHWKKHMGEQFSVSNLPQISFDQESVVAVHGGTYGTGGYSTWIDQIRISGDTLIVKVGEEKPGPTEPVTTAVTQPFQMVRVPRVAPSTRLVVER